MIVREIEARSILFKSLVYDYVVNAYTGCQHACTYCYARFMKRFTGHREPWGQFVDVKTNAPDLLRAEISRKKLKGRVWVSGVCDPYQPLESRYRVTRKCLEILISGDWPVSIQTRSALVLRDVDLLKHTPDVVVTMTVATADDRIRKIFEPNAPSVEDRFRGLGELHAAGIKTHAMIAPMLPGAEGLPARLAGKVDYVLVDRMNYHYADWVYRKYALESAMGNEFFLRAGTEIAAGLREVGIECRLLF
jgi:DNA repair photolyase